MAASRRGEAQPHLVVGVVGADPADQAVGLLAAAGLVLDDPEPGLVPARLGGGLGWLVDPGIHGHAARSRDRLARNRHQRAKRCRRRRKGSMPRHGATPAAAARDGACSHSSGITPLAAMIRPSRDHGEGRRSPAGRWVRMSSSSCATPNTPPRIRRRDLGHVDVRPARWCRRGWHGSGTTNSSRPSARPVSSRTSRAATSSRRLARLDQARHRLDQPGLARAGRCSRRGTARPARPGPAIGIVGQDGDGRRAARTARAAAAPVQPPSNRSWRRRSTSSL